MVTVLQEAVLHVGMPEEIPADFNAIYRLGCERARYDQVIQVRQSLWEQDPDKARRAMEWLHDKGGLHDTEEGFEPPITTVAMWWRDWNSVNAVNWFAFADHRLACEFKLNFG